MTAFTGERRAQPQATATPARVWRCVLIGSEPLLIECAAMLRERGHDVAAIVTSRAMIRDWAQAQGMPVLPGVTALRNGPVGAFDYLFSITNLQLLAPDILALPTAAAINFHDGPLPAYAGLNTPVWALLNGEPRHGVTWHLMDERVDTGAILATRGFDLDGQESAHAINTKCFAAAIESFAELIDELAANRLRPVTQATAPVRYYGREHRPRAATTINWQQGAKEVAALVRCLDFGGHANPLGCPKFRIGEDVVLVTAAHASGVATPLCPGTVTRTDAEGIGIATASGEVLLTRLATCAGKSLDPIDAALLFGLHAGRRIGTLPDDHLTMLGDLDAAVAAYEPWWRNRLQARDPLTLPPFATAPGRAGQIDMMLSDGASAATVLAAMVGFLGRTTDRPRFDIGFTDPIFVARFDGLAPWFARQLPLRAAIDFDQGLALLDEAISAEVRELHHHVGHAADLIARSPELHGTAADLPVAVTIVDRLDDACARPGAQLTVAIRSDGGAARWLCDDGIDAAALQASFAVMLAAALAEPDRAIGTLPLLDDTQRTQVIDHWNATAVDAGTPACVHQLFVEQARRTPDAPAVTSRGITLSYAELDARSNQLARHLQQLGVGPDRLVGLSLERSVDMTLALIAIHKAGGAYVPLDPAYPADRIAHMVRDSGASIIITQAGCAGRLPVTDATILRIDTDWPSVAAQSAEHIDGSADPAHLAYVIYTSGSTGLPKGVAVEHRQVANFFAGMDQLVAPGGTWLAVTSLNFDISVLELCWTLARGCHVVIATGDEMTRPATAPARALDFSLFYFASADGGQASDQYRLLLDGARFADTHGFAAVWTPERHFHAFGGLYPNPSVTSAAIAAITTRIAIRGGSVVMPLHHPARVAEEWSLVDNLSNGRVGIAFASGWQPNDFVLRPESFADKTTALMSGIDTVRALWRGETRSFPGPLGTPVDVAIYPRPVQPELPFWITSAGNPETFAAAGRAGANVLTHLLGQTVDELAAKLAAYRAAWRTAGHAGEGHVTLMLHSFVGEDEAQVRETVRQPLIDYLRTSTNLVKEFAWSFPAFKRRPGMAEDGATPDLATLDDGEMAALLDFAFERYYRTGGLFGTPAACMAMIEQVRRAGVNEIGCLIDFGVPAQTVLDHLPALDTLRRLAQADTTTAPDTLPTLMARHGVTHLQCTPSMAQMLASDDAARAALAGLRQLLVGGEAFPPALAADLHALVGGTVHNMYGPTETTIWSASHVVSDEVDRVPLGRPLANQQVYVVDSRQQLVLPGLPGELVIGGHGVVRGYHQRPALTAERFIDHPFAPGHRAYRTGDLGRQRADGKLEFLGRLDHQVKVRGHRIELGEIEAVLGRHPGIKQAVVTAREDTPGDVRLVGYFLSNGASPAQSTLRDHLAAHLPDFMVPAQLVALADWPRTPNGKIDRAALPAPEAAAPAPQPMSFTAPAGGLEAEIAGVWREVLKLTGVGTRDNFFDLGGHSLLAVQVHRRLREVLGRALPLTDVFRYPTIEALAAHLATPDADDTAARQGHARAAGRRAALQRRMGVRTPTMIVEEA